MIAGRSAAQAELGAARKDLNEKASKYTEQHPDVRAAQARLALAESSLKHAEDAIAAAQPAEEAPVAPHRPVVANEDPYGEDAGAAKQAPVAGIASVAPPRREVFAAPEEKVVSLEVDWSRMQRALTIARQHQGDLESKLYKAEMVASTTESGYGTTIAVLDPAYRPGGPSNAPNKVVVMMGLGVSIAVGLVLSAAWGLFLDDRVFSASEIEVIVMVPVLGVVPKDKKSKKKGKDGKDKPKEALAKGKPPAAKPPAAKPVAGAAAVTRGTTSG